MTKEKAISKAMKDLKLPDTFEYYVTQTFNRLGCEESVDLETYNCVRDYLRKDINNK